MPWTATSSASSIAWAQLSAITDATGGVDFILRVNDEFPMRVIDARPLFISDSSGFQTP